MTTAGFFTPGWLVAEVWTCSKKETERRVLESACGSGNSLIQVLRRKLASAG